jgi:hypothetical protein
VTLSAPWAEVGETDAPGEIAEIYADIRAMSGMPAINLIYRNMAAIPGALVHVWRFLRPLFASGIAHEFDREIRHQVTLPTFSSFSPSALAAARLTEADRYEITDILNFYATANAMNLLALSVLLKAFNNEHRPSESLLRNFASRAPERLNPIRPILPIDALSADVRATIADLNPLGEGPVSDPIAPSLFRHLAYWPSFLGLIADHLRPADADGSLAGEASALRAHAGRRATSLSGALPPDQLAKLDGSARRQSKMLAQQFANLTIPRLLVICLLLRRVVAKAS